MGIDYHRTVICLATGIISLTTWFALRQRAKLERIRKQLAKKEEILLLEQERIRELELKIKHSEINLLRTTTELKKIKIAYYNCVAELETANFPIFCIDVDRKISDWNKKAVEVTGFEKEEAIGKDLINMICEEDRESVRKILDEILEETNATGEQSHRNLEFTMENSRNQKLSILLNATTRKDTLFSINDGEQGPRMEELPPSPHQGTSSSSYNPIPSNSQPVSPSSVPLSPSHSISIPGSPTQIQRKDGNSKFCHLRGFAIRTSNPNNPQARSRSNPELIETDSDFSNRGSGLLCIAQDVTEDKLEARRRLNYLDVCGAAVWSLKARFDKNKFDLNMGEIEQLISTCAKTNLWDPRMVLWRASFASIVTTMCRGIWEKRQIQIKQSQNDGASQNGAERVQGSFSYEFSFEATNGQVKWYKVEGHEDLDSIGRNPDFDFEVMGYVQEVTLMYIEKITGDRWQKWWSKMCHMVFDATLLVDTQEYRVLNAWGEEKVFGGKVQCPTQSVLQLVITSDGDSMKEALNEVTCTEFHPGKSIRLVRPTDRMEIPAQCFFLAADPENPNECMVGIRLSEIDNDGGMWNVSPCRFLTLEDLSRVAHVAPHSSSRARSHKHRHTRKNGVRKREMGGGSSTSLTSIPEDIHEDALNNDVADSSEASTSSNDTTSRDAMANASIDARSLPSLQERLKYYMTDTDFFPQTLCKGHPLITQVPIPPKKPIKPVEFCQLKYQKQTHQIPIMEVETYTLLIEKIEGLIGVKLEGRMRVVMSGRQIQSDEAWADVWSSRHEYKKISLMIIGTRSPQRIRSKGCSEKLDTPVASSPEEIN